MKVREFSGWIVFFCMLFFSLNLGAVEDNASVRFSYRKELASGVVSNDLEAKTIFLTNEEGRGGRVRFQFNRQGGNLYYFFSNEISRDVFPLYSTGSYIIRKNSVGEIDQIKIFLLHRDDSFIRLISEKGQTRASVELLGKVVYNHIHIPKSLSYFALAPLNELKNYLEPSLYIGFLFPRYQLVNKNVVSMLSEIRNRLKGFPEVKDGAMDARGDFVHIADASPQLKPFGFNCSGFAKWIADGIYEPATGKLLSIDRLKRRLLGARGNIETLPYERSRDPYFSLDWTRNIATVLSFMNENQSVNDLDSEKQDVRIVPFLTYVEDRGFSLDDLELALYLLAVNNPENFYFGSVSTPFGRDPVLIQHRHVTVLFPWIDEKGFFRISVMDVNAETNLSSLKIRYPEGYINLVNVRAKENFLLRAIPSPLGQAVEESTEFYLQRNLR